MRAGQLHERVTLSDRVDGQDAIGGTVQSWTNVRQRWAAVDTISAREFMAGAGRIEAEESTTIFRLRYDGALGQTSKITWRGEDYDIVQIRDVQGRKRELEVLAKRSKPNG